MPKITNILVSLLVIVAVVCVCFPLISNGFIVTDDGGWMIIRFSSFYQELIHGQFPVRWLNRLNNGYGYPVSTFLYPGFMYFASLFKALGFDYIASIKLTVAFSVGVTASFIYLWLKKYFSSVAALVGGVGVVLSPYYLFDIYQRGSVGEIFAISWIAVALYTIAHKRLLLTSLVLALIIISHNTLALLFLPVLLIYLWLESSSWKHVLLVLLISIGLAAFYWMPILFELKFTQFGSVQISEYSKHFARGQSFNFFGYAQILVFILAVFQLFHKKINHRLWFFGLLAIVGGFLSLPVSSFIWRNTDLTQYIQFPFRFVSLWVIACAYLSAWFVNKFLLYKNITVAGIILLLLFSWWGMLTNVEYSQLPDSYFATNEATTTVKDEYMPVWVTNKPEEHSESLVQVLQGEAEILEVSDGLNRVTILVNSRIKSLLQLNKIFWLGWRLTVDGEKREIKFQNSKGLMQFEVLPGESVVEFVFDETKYRLVSDVISGATFIILILLWIKKPKFI